jgi:hypothetical protein
MTSTAFNRSIGNSRLKPEHRERHTLEPIDVEGAYCRQQFFQTKSRSGKDQYITCFINAQGAAFGNKRGQDVCDFGRRCEL